MFVVIKELLNVLPISTEAIRDVDGIYMSLKLLFCCFLFNCTVLEEHVHNVINFQNVSFIFRLFSCI